MAKLNNDLVELLDKTEATPLEIILVLKFMQETLSKNLETFIVKTLTESEKTMPSVEATPTGG